MGLFKRKRKRADGSERSSEHWWGTFYDHERKCVSEPRSTKCRDKHSARMVLQQWERDSADPARNATRSVPFRVARATFLDTKNRQVTAGKRSKKTWEFYEQKTANLANILGDEKLVREISALDVDKYIAQRQDEGAHPNTISKEMTALRGVLKLAHRHKFCDHPASIMPLDHSAEYVPKSRYLGNDLEAQLLLDELEDDRKAHVLFFIATGARDSESVSAQPEHVDFEKGMVRLLGTKTVGSYREVPIARWNAPLLKSVLELAPGKRLLFRPWSNIRRDLHDACDRAQIERLSPNDLRRTFSQWQRLMGLRLDLLAASLGHVDTRMVEKVYGKLSSENLRDMVRQSLGDGARFGQEGGINSESSETSENHESPYFPVPRRRIELRTRGFSVLDNVKTIRTKTRVIARDLAGRRTKWPAQLTVGEALDAALSLGAPKAKRGAK